MKLADKKNNPVAAVEEQKKRIALAPDGFVTRQVLQERVGISASQFRRLSALGLISSEGVNGHGYVVYSMQTVDRLVRMKADGTLFRTVSDAPSHVTNAANPSMRYSAEEGVRAFELFDQGKSIKDVVLQTKIHPLVVKEIRIDYDELTGSIHLTKADVDKINAIRNLPGRTPRDTPGALVECLELYALERKCKSDDCTAEALNECEACVTHRFRLERQRAARDAAAPSSVPSDRYSSEARDRHSGPETRT